MDPSEIRHKPAGYLELGMENMKLRNQLATLTEAAKVRLESGHNDTCGSLLVPDSPCSCGHDALDSTTGGDKG